MVDFFFHRNRVGDLQTRDIQYVIAVVRDERSIVFHTQHGTTAQRIELAGDETVCHRDDFDREREAAEHGDLLGFVRDADETVGCRSDDFFASQRTAATLDHGAGAGNFVGAVNINRNGIDFVKVKHTDAVRLEPLCRGFR